MKMLSKFFDVKIKLIENVEMTRKIKKFGEENHRGLLLIFV